MSLKLNSSGGGSVTVQEPTTASNVTLNLPAADGTVVYENSSGNVGIGTSSPTSRLHVHTAGSSYSIVQITNGDTGSTVNDGLHIGMDNNGTTAAFNIRDASGVLVFRTQDAERARIDSSGRLGIGVTPNTGWVTSWNVIDVGNSSGLTSPNDGNTVVCGNTYFNGSNWIRKTANYAANIECNATGKISTYTAASSSAGSTISWTAGPYVANLGTSWTNSSDERLKDIIEPITDAANKVGQLRAVIGKFKTDPEDKRRSFLIAQDVQVVLPEAVDASDPDSLGVQYTDVIPLLVAAIKEQQQMIETLQAKVAALEAK